MDADGGIWTILTIVGPLVLLVALAWAMMNNRRSRAEERRTEEATRANYAEQERADKASEVQ